MYSLYIDTSKYISVGLLDSNHSWVDYCVIKNLKASAAIHSIIYDMCKKKGLDLLDIDNVFYCAGPGSYTGMRVGSGIAQMLKMAQKNVFSFYHHEVPWLIGIDEGSWVSDAFKNELFCYKWKEDKTTISLVDKDKFEETSYYSSFERDESYNTSDLIQKNSKVLFQRLFDTKSFKSNFYYRSLEDEFGRK